MMTTTATDANIGPMAESRGTRSKLTAAFVGYDAFISYARSDGTAYARALHTRLESAGLVTFVDYQAIPPGEGLRKVISRGIRRSRMFVVVCSAGAVQSPWVALEVKDSLELGRNPVVINVDAALVQATWTIERDLVWIPETAAALAAGEPSVGIVEEVLKRVEFTRRQTLVVRILSAIMAVLVALTGAIAWNWRQAVVQRETALAQKLVALSETERQLAPEQLDRISLMLLESLRRRETPEAIGALASTTRLLRPLVAEANVGRSTTKTLLSSDGLLIASTGDNDTQGRFVGVWDARTLVAKWKRDMPAGKTATARMAWSPNGDQIAWTGGSANVELLAADTGRTVATLAAQADVSDVSFSPDGRWVAVGSMDGLVRVWDRSSGAVAATLRAGRNILGMAFAPDSRTLVYGGGIEDDRTASPPRRAFLGAVTPGEWETSLRAVASPIAVTEIVFSPDSRSFAIPGSPAPLVSTLTLRAERDLSNGLYVGAVAFSRDGQYVLTTTSDGAVRVSLRINGEEIARYPHTDFVNAAVFSPDARLVATASGEGMIRIWRVTKENPLFDRMLSARPEQARLSHGVKALNVFFDPSGPRLFASGNGRLRTWSLTTNIPLWTVENEAILKLAISTDGKSFVTAGADYRPGLWPVAAEDAPRRLARHDNDLSDAGFSPDGRWLVTADSDDLAFVFPTSSYTPVARLQARTIAVGNNEVITIAGQKLRRYAIPSGTVIEEFPMPSRVTAIAVSSTNQLAAAMSDGAVVVRDLAGTLSVEKLRLQVGRDARAVAFSTAGDLLAAGDSTGAVRIWRTSGQPYQVLSLGSQVNAIAFDRSGTFVAAGGKSGAALVWSIGSGELVARLAHLSEIFTIAFTPAGPDLLFVGGYGGFSSTLWRSADIRHEACARLSRSTMTTDEWQSFVQLGDPVDGCR
jgi:WD40 repeat protein